MANPIKYAVGTLHQTLSCGEVEIIANFRNNKSTIQFSKTGSVITVTRDAIGSGRVRDPATLKYAVGSVHPTRNFGDVEITQRLPNNKFVVKFLNTGHEQECYYSNLVNKGVRDHSIPKEQWSKRVTSAMRAKTKRKPTSKYAPGVVYSTLYYGDVEVIEPLPNRRVKVRFLETGSVIEVGRDPVRTGHIKDPAKPRVSAQDRSPRLMVTGEVVETGHGTVEVIGAAGSMRTVRFQETGSVVTVHLRTLQDGTVKDYMIPSVRGVGYLGSQLKNLNKDPAHQLWCGVLRRVEELGCTADEDWYNFTLFREQIKGLVNYDKWLEHGGAEYHLDKDLLFPGTRHYGVESCTFLSFVENVTEAYLRRYRNHNPSENDVKGSPGYYMGLAMESMREKYAQQKAEQKGLVSVLDQ